MIKPKYFTLLLFFVSHILFGQSSQNSIFDQMHYQEVLDVTLEANLSDIKNNRRSDEDYPASLVFEDKNGTTQKWNLQVSIRGAFRRMNCTEIPPLKLKFKKSDLEAAGLDKFNDMKLVTQCVEDREEAIEFVKKEYLAYQMYQSLTEYSFRTQLLRITYADPVSGKKSKQWAFLIEDFAQLRDRFDAEQCEDCYNRPIEEFHVAHLDRVAVFQYMIGNADWSIARAKNVKMIFSGEKLIPIPYDFDFSGMVDASYATASSEYGITNISERVYLGLSDSKNLQNTLALLEASKPNLIEMVKSAKYLNIETRLSVKDYLESFFKDQNQIRTPSDWAILKGTLSQKQE